MRHWWVPISQNASGSWWAGSTRDKEKRGFHGKDEILTLQAFIMPDLEEYLSKGYHIDRYYVLEEDLLEFLRFLPLEFYPKYSDRLNIKSTYLADLLLRIGSNIDIFFSKYIKLFPEIAEKASITSKERTKINGYIKLEPLLKLSSASVIVNPICHISDEMYPFRMNGENSGRTWDEILKPDNNDDFWWRSYQKIKHKGIFDKANLDNVLQSIAALLILISYYPHIQKLEQYSYLKIKSECELLLPSPRHQYLPQDCFINTRLFFRDELLNPGTLPLD